MSESEQPSFDPASEEYQLDRARQQADEMIPKMEESLEAKRAAELDRRIAEIADEKSAAAGGRDTSNYEAEQDAAQNEDKAETLRAEAERIGDQAGEDYDDRRSKELDDLTAEAREAIHDAQDESPDFD
jgi:hypothetical protein